MLRTRTLLSGATAVCLLAGCATTPAPAPVPGLAPGLAPMDTRDQFMATLRTMCGQRFVGGLTYAIDPRNDFANKKMSAQVVCTDASVRVPLQVGADRSRNWIFTRPPAGLELRHDHRHPDGTPDAVTMYGGMADDTGTAWSQSFLADAHTAAMVPGADTNVWTVSFSEQGKILTYRLTRHGKPRAQFVLIRQSGS